MLVRTADGSLGSSPSLTFLSTLRLVNGRLHSIGTDVEPKLISKSAGGLNATGNFARMAADPTVNSNPMFRGRLLSAVSEVSNAVPLTNRRSDCDKEGQRGSEVLHSIDKLRRLNHALYRFALSRLAKSASIFPASWNSVISRSSRLYSAARVPSIRIPSCLSHEHAASNFASCSRYVGGSCAGRSSLLLQLSCAALREQTAIHLSRRFRSAQAFTVEPRPVEAANASLSGSEHRAGIFDPARARLFLLGGGDPVDPIPARVGRDVRP